MAAVVSCMDQLLNPPSASGQWAVVADFWHNFSHWGLGSLLTFPVYPVFLRKSGDAGLTRGDNADHGELRIGDRLLEGLIHNSDLFPSSPRLAVVI